MYKSQYITIFPSQSNTWYSPKQVSFKVVDYNNNVVPGAVVNATAFESTLPGGISGASDSLVLNYGIPREVADQMVDEAGHMVGTTGTDGKVTFTMHGSIMYRIIVNNAYTISLYPLDNLYVVYVTSSTYTAPQNEINYIRDEVIQVLNVTIPNASYVKRQMYYQDLSGRTNYIMFWVKNTQNNTVVYWDNRTVTGTQLILANKTIRNDRGSSWRWGYDAYHT
jgi:hypothetical protein